MGKTVNIILLLLRIEKQSKRTQINQLNFIEVNVHQSKLRSGFLSHILSIEGKRAPSFLSSIMKHSILLNDVFSDMRYHGQSVRHRHVNGNHGQLYMTYAIHHINTLQCTRNTWSNPYLRVFTIICKHLRIVFTRLSFQLFGYFHM